MAIPVSVSLDNTTLALLKYMAASLGDIASKPDLEEQLEAIAKALAAGIAAITSIDTTLGTIAKAIEVPPMPVPVSIRLALPTIKRNGIIMANFELANDEVATIPILVDDAAGVPVPPPAGDTFTAVSSSASLGVSIVASPPAVVLTPLVQASPGITVTVSDSAGLTSFSQLVDIVQDTTPKAITLDLANVTEVAQPVPTATGP